MKTANIKPTFARALPALALALCGLGNDSRAAAVDVSLRVETIVVPGGVGTPGILGNQAPVTMWGYVQTTAGSPLPGASPWAPPTISAAKGDTLTIHLSNALSGPYTEPTSVIIPGQPGTLTPVFTDGSTAPRSSPEQRVRSFNAETAVGGSGDYTFGPLVPGTYLVQTGTHPGVQLQMGLYAVLKVYAGAGVPVFPATAGQAYDDPSSAFDSEATALFSEVDPVLHGAVAAGTYGPSGTVTSPVNFAPQYFLINGTAYAPANPPLPGGLTNQTLLLRFLNAGLLSHVPTVLGPTFSVIAEDGNFLAVSGLSSTNNLPAGCAGFRQQDSVLLPAGKTMDALLIPAAVGNTPLFDRRNSLTNGGVSPGGMLTYLAVAGVGVADIVPPAPCTLGETAPYFVASASNVTFASVRPGTSPVPAATFTITNTGTAAGQVTGMTLVNNSGSYSGGAHFTVTASGPFPINVPVGGSTAVSVTFTSTSSTPLGTKTATATFATSALGSPSLPVTLSTALATPLAVSTSSLPGVLAGAAYNRTLAATGGVPPYGSWTITAGSLPPGLGLSAAGQIAGTVPAGTAPATYSFTVRVTDAAGSNASRALSIQVVTPLVITTTSPLPNATRLAAYSQVLAGTGGQTPYTWTRTSGALPPGLTLNSSTGRISGTVSSTATSGTAYNFTIRLSDSSGTTPVGKSFRITIN